jgi:hypothetical protein
MRGFYIFFLLLLLNIPAFASGGEENKLFSLYPVPLKGSRLSVKLNTGNSGIIAVELRNLIGKKLQNRQFAQGEIEITFEDMDVYPNGVYVVLGKDIYGKIVEISKFIINK